MSEYQSVSVIKKNSKVFFFFMRFAIKITRFDWHTFLVDFLRHTVRGMINQKAVLSNTSVEKCNTSIQTDLITKMTECNLEKYSMRHLWIRSAAWFSGNKERQRNGKHSLWWWCRVSPRLHYHVSNNALYARSWLDFQNKAY